VHRHRQRAVVWPEVGGDHSIAAAEARVQRAVGVVAEQGKVPARCGALVGVAGQQDLAARQDNRLAGEVVADVRHGDAIAAAEGEVQVAGGEQAAGLQWLDRGCQNASATPADVAARRGPASGTAGCGAGGRAGLAAVHEWSSGGFWWSAGGDQTHIAPAWRSAGVHGC
jgi:hypothetical protein